MNENFSEKKHKDSKGKWLTKIAAANQALLFILFLTLIVGAVFAVYGYISAFYGQKIRQESASIIGKKPPEQKPPEIEKVETFSYFYGDILNISGELPILLEVLSTETPEEDFLLDVSIRGKYRNPYQLINWVIKDRGKDDVTLFATHKKILQYRFFISKEYAPEASLQLGYYTTKSEKPIAALIGVYVDEDESGDGTLDYRDECELFYYDLTRRRYHSIIKNRRGIVLGAYSNNMLPIYVKDDKGRTIEARLYDVVEKGIIPLADAELLERINKMEGLP